MSGSIEPFSVALAQAEPRLFSKEENLSRAEMLIRQAGSLGAGAVIFPELFLTGYSLQERAVELAETLDGPSVKRIADAAARSRIAVFMGYPERTADDGPVYDSVFAVNAAGRVCGSYRKIHLFQDENRWFLPGDQPCVLDVGLGPVGLLICYDLEFPEAARQLALQGAAWIAVSTGNMLPNQHQQEVYVQARAAENRCWVALANRVGREGDLTFFGGSAVADPFGELAVQAGDGETLLLAQIDLARADQARLNADYLADRKPAVYRTWGTP
jgi:predicted amidohydrolase